MYHSEDITDEACFFSTHVNTLQFCIRRCAAPSVTRALYNRVPRFVTHASRIKTKQPKQTDRQRPKHSQPSAAATTNTAPFDSDQSYFEGNELRDGAR